MLELKNINMSFDEKVIFNDFSYQFPDNKIIGILGRSGCGKSTLLRIIAGLQKPNSGEIILNDKKVLKPSDNIFMMHQKYANFPWMNCYNNVLLPIKVQSKVTKEHQNRAIDILNKVGLSEYAFKFPYELSGGMQQRLALARTIMDEPPVVLMDEPLSALDPNTRSAMQDLILDMHYRTKNIIIMVTHDPNEAKKMSDIILNL